MLLLSPRLLLWHNQVSKPQPQARWEGCHRGSRSEPRDTCPTEGQGGCALTPGSSQQWRRLGLLSTEGFPEPSGLKPGPSEPRLSALIGADTPGQGFVHPAPEDSRVRSWVFWAGQKQFLHISEFPSPLTAPPHTNRPST